MRFALKRLGFYFVTVWMAITLNFFLPRLMPGNPAAAALSSETNTLPPQALKAMTVAFGLHTKESLVRPVRALPFEHLPRAAGRLGHLFTTRCGRSFGLRCPGPRTRGRCTVLGFLIGTGLGVIAGWRRGTRWELIVPVGTFCPRWRTSGSG